MTKIPPAPEGWNKTLADLDAEYRSGARRTFGSPETEWAIDYERSLLPADTRFPRAGDVYEALEDFEVGYLTSWDAPFTGGGEGKLRRGEQVAIRYVMHPQPIAVGAYPVNYREVETRVVPESERKAKGYGGFHFTVKTADLNTKFRLVREGGDPGTTQDRRSDAGPTGA